MKTHSTQRLLLLALFAVAPSQAASAQDRYEAQVRGQLGNVASAFIANGYTPVVEDGGSLGHRGSEDYTVNLEAGVSYMLMGVCDQDCVDLDLELYDSAGNLVSRDTSTDDAPVVEVSVSRDSAFTLRATMYECHENPCYYGVGLYRQGSGDPYEQQVLLQLQQAANLFTSEGFTALMGDGGGLDNRRYEDYAVTLDAGRNYVLVGVCDEDCLDLDLELYDPKGNLVSKDESDDDAPIVEVSVTRGGAFTLRALMYECHENPCYYGVGLYGR